MWRIVMMTILCMQLVACSIGSSTPITAAVATCKLTNSDFVEVMDDGHSLMLKGRGSATLFESIDQTGTACMLQELGVPVYLRQLMRWTRNSDGMQQEEFGGYKIYWSDHSDYGLNIIIHMK